MDEKERLIRGIINNRQVYTVFQPIIKLKNGSVFGYEALSRIADKECFFNIEEIFGIAEEVNLLWEFDSLCRKTAVKSASDKPKNAKLFINVDPNIINDPELKSGFTCKALKKYSLCPDDIVFEVTEKNAIVDFQTFNDAVEHYKGQNFKIAVDDVGTGYSGLDRICQVAPNYIKIDIHIVKGIDCDDFKKSAVRSIVQFCNEADIKVIAEGIETKEEMETLMSLGVRFGQGYYLSKPCEGFESLNDNQICEITGCRNRMKYGMKSTVFDVIGTICHPDAVVNCDSKAIDVYSMIHENQYVKDVYVIDEERKVCGILTRSYLCDKFSGQYGFNLNRKKYVHEIMLKDYLEVEDDMLINEVARAAIDRPVETEYDAVVVTHKRRYVGIVTVKELLKTAIDIQVRMAADANPLTGLPGNNMIQSRIQQAIDNNAVFEAAYIDLDNFKAYNDAYGFSNGDCMIRVLAECISSCIGNEDFAGHIGGDDFVAVSYELSLEKKCNKIIRLFNESIINLYKPDDINNGYIISKNRNGFIEQFPIATLSVAIVNSDINGITSMKELSELIAKTKKKAKQIEGNSVVTA